MVGRARTRGLGRSQWLVVTSCVLQRPADMRIVASLGVAIAITLATGELVERRGDEPVRYEGVEPGWSYTTVVVGGWPLPFLYDKPGLSVANRVSTFAALLREDEFRAMPFVADVVVYAAVMIVVGRLARRH